MNEAALQAALDRAKRTVDAWPESVKIAMRVGKYADPKEELKAVEAVRERRAAPTCEKLAAWLEADYCRVARVIRRDGEWVVTFISTPHRAIVEHRGDRLVAVLQQSLDAENTP